MICITAYDAGVDHVLSYGSVTVEDVRNLVYGAMFTRGGDDLKNSAIFIGGSSVPVGEAMLKAVQDAFFGPVRVSVMADPNGSNTTAVAAVLKIIRAVPVAGKRAVILAGTGPVGVRAATLLAKEGCQVVLTSRTLSRAQDACRAIHDRFNLDITPLEVRDEATTARAVDGANVILTCGAAGIELVKKEVWSAIPSCRGRRRCECRSADRRRRHQAVRRWQTARGPGGVWRIGHRRTQDEDPPRSQLPGSSSKTILSST